MHLGLPYSPCRVCCILSPTLYVPQGLASLLAPYLIIHTTVSAATKACKQMGKFQRYGPTVSGKSVIIIIINQTNR